MSILMVVATVTGASPMPEPIPKAVVATLFGSGLPKPVLLVLVVGLHLGYGGFFGAVLARGAQPVTIWKGLGLGVVLLGTDANRVPSVPRLGSVWHCDHS